MYQVTHWDQSGTTHKLDITWEKEGHKDKPQTKHINGMQDGEERQYRTIKQDKDRPYTQTHKQTRR